MAEKLLDIKQTKRVLRYIAKSPAREYGGFHPQTILAAKSALKHLRVRKFPTINQTERRD